MIKTIAMDDEVWCKVDVCELCMTMYPRGRTEVKVTPAKKQARPKKATGKAKPKKKAKKR
jgi:hypothetical protein